MESIGKRIAFWVFLFTGGSVFGFDPEKDGIDKIKKFVRRRFPEVRQLRALELDAWLADPNRPPPQILDVRRPDEFAVSHLAAARQVDPDANGTALRSLVADDRPVVVYCSVGYRSSRLARRLMKAGVADVFNLEGSIFEWANQGRSLVNSNGPAAKVHPYSDHWKALLNPRVRASAD